jgi:AsmA family protein
MFLYVNCNKLAPIKYLQRNSVMGKIIKILVVLVLIVIVALAGIIFTTDINQYKDQIVQVVKDNTGRDFQISGDLKLAPSLIPTVAVEGVTLGNASWANEKDMLSVSKFEAQIALLPLLKKNIQVIKFILIEPIIHLETNSKGEGNWVLATPTPKEKESATESTPAALPGLAVNEVHIKDANISYKDGKTGETTELYIDEVTVNSDSFTDPMSLFVKADINESPLEMKGTLGSINILLDNKDYPINIKGSIAGVDISIEGKLGQPMDAKGIDLLASLNIKELSSLNKLAGSELPEVGPIIFSGKLSDTKSGYSIKSMAAQIMEYKVNGDIEISLGGARPKLIANLATDSLDVSPFQGAPEKEAVKKEKVFPSDPLPLDGLKAADVDLKFKAKKLITKDLTFDDVNLALTLNNGKLQLTQNAKAAGGTISASINLDGSNGKSATLSNNIELKQVELGLITAIKDKELLTGGKTDVTIKANGSGASVSKIMAGLNGKLLIKVGKGQISNTALDIASADVLTSTLSMLNPGAKKDDGSTLECAVINFDIKDGIATADKGIAISTNQINVMGSGSVNLKTETLDIGITPKAREGVGINVSQLAELVRLGGTLANPAPKTDTKAALKAGLSVGAAVATGGLSILAQGLLDKSGADENPCDIALGIAPKKTTAKPASEKSTVEKTTDTVKDAASAVGDKLKSLF